jgi:hypothetical protein
VKTKEILLIGILFFAGFVLLEFLIEHIFKSPFPRLIARIVFQGQFYLILYLLFNSWDISKRMKWLELTLIRERRTRLRLRQLRQQIRIGRMGRNNYGK